MKKTIVFFVAGVWAVGVWAQMTTGTPLEKALLWPLYRFGILTKKPAPLIV